MDRWENTFIRGIHASRYIASWIKIALRSEKKVYVSDFSNWLKSLGLSGDEISRIVFLYVEGKLELEDSARNFIKNIEG